MVSESLPRVPAYYVLEVEIFKKFHLLVQCLPEPTFSNYKPRQLNPLSFL